MDRELVSVLAAKLGEKTRVEGSALRAVVQHGDSWHSTRVRTEPVAEVFVATRALDGFTLSITWGDRWRDPDIGDPTFDSAFAIETNDVAFARSWLDDASRAALLASAYIYQSNVLSDDEFIEAPALTRRVMRTWTYELANDEIVVTKGSREIDPERFMSAVATACTVAARSQRWATEYAELARKLGGSAASEVEIGGAPILSATRSAIEVSVRLVRRAKTDGERLRTIISAPRIGEGRLALWNDALPKNARPDVSAGDRRSLELGDYKLRASSQDAANKLDELGRKLVAAAQPAVAVVDADSVDLWFDGALQDFTRLDAALALAARLAVDAIAPQGPYR